MRLKNSGTAISTLISAFINDIEVDNYDESAAVQGAWATNINITSATTLTSGEAKTVYFWIDSGKAGFTLSSGTTVNVKIHSAGGMDYIKLVELV
jgi:hypothetical protein